MFLHAGQSQACLETREQLEARLRATPQIHHESKRAHTEPHRMWAPHACSGQGQAGHQFLDAPELTTRGQSCTARHKLCALG